MYDVHAASSGFSVLSLLHPVELLQGLGSFVLLGVFVIIVIESGVLFPFLPGDSLLFTAAVAHSQLGFSFGALLAVGIVAAIVGDFVGYWLGSRFGRRLFTPNARVLKTRHLDAAEVFFAKYGARAIFLARFVPIVRTFVPLAAGISRYDRRRFAVWNVVSAFAWVASMVVAGALLGGIPFVAKNIDAICMALIAITVIPGLIHMYRRSRAEKAAE
ncbi:VTT domain-containing protein [Micrococcales bacterium 31B]|nr:VTT domain-containing protein [Micrococcales bacterium 31B]